MILLDESCECPDFRKRQLPCKHVYAASIVRAKSSECCGCGKWHPNRKVVEVMEDYESLTRFVGTFCVESALETQEFSSG